MSWPAIESFHKWTKKRKGLLQGLLGLAVEGIAGWVPGGVPVVWATRILGEFAKYGVERLADPSKEVDGIKPAGQSFSKAELEQLNSWLASLSNSYSKLLDQLSKKVNLEENDVDKIDMTTLLREVLSQNADLASKFDFHAEEVRRQTLSLTHIEQVLEEIVHSNQGVTRILQEIKILILRMSPPPNLTFSVYSSPPPPSKTDIVNSIGMRFAHIPAGQFRMGSPNSEPERHPAEGPQHEVRITNSFYMGIYPATQHEYETIMGRNPAYFNSANRGGHNHPVERVKWYDAETFCNRLTNLPTERESRRVYRLPTEAEWEYACRAGMDSIFQFGDALSANQANLDGNYPYGSAAKGPYLGKTTPVGSYPANHWGLYDMHGNVWEWCSDWTVEFRDENYYSISPTTDPAGLSEGKYRIIRGGSWCDPAKNCRSAARGAWGPGGWQSWLGFRVILLLMDRE